VILFFPEIRRPKSGATIFCPPLRLPRFLHRDALDCSDLRTPASLSIGFSSRRVAENGEDWLRLSPPALSSPSDGFPLHSTRYFVRRSYYFSREYFRPCRADSPAPLTARAPRHSPPTRSSRVFPLVPHLTAEIGPTWCQKSSEPPFYHAQRSRW